jgi:peptide/nickel transport system permease protein
MTDALRTETRTPAAVEKGESLFRRRLSEFFESRSATFGLALLVLLLAAAIFAPWIAPQNPYDLAQLDIMDGKLPPGGASMDGRIHWLGTDEQGRDMLSAILYGLRISLFVAVVSTVAALSIGAAVGVLAAFKGGRVENFVMRAVDLQLSFPAILIALVLLAAFGRGVDKVIIALIVVQWAYYARTVRGSALVERNRDYIEAARCLALPKSRIVFRHLLPNCLPPLIVGVPVTEPSLGMLIKNGYDYLMSGKYWISTYPGVALVIAIVAINMVGDRLRDVLNPRLSK